jgi:hypothetical protein
MTRPDPHDSRPETVLGAALYLMTAYQRNRCPQLAACVSAHLDCLAAHPQVTPVLRELCDGLRSDWRAMAGHPGPGAARVH